MIFQNFEVTPQGNAQLSINQGKLLISNIGNSGLDGVMVNVSGHDSYEIHFNEIPSVLQGGVMRIATIGKNSLNQISTISEKIIWYDPATNLVQYGFNMCLLPEQYTLFGKLNGNNVFEIQKHNPIYPSAKLGWIAIASLIVAVVAAGAAVYSALKTKHTRTITRVWGDHGNLISETIIETDDPQPFELIVDGQTYLVDYWGITYTMDVNNPSYAQYANSDVATQITGYNLNSIEIPSIV
jgi:hypothetical protein